jgi:hypothetical protein
MLQNTFTDERPELAPNQESMPIKFEEFIDLEGSFQEAQRYSLMFLPI